jgi:iron complex transport system substrate-binding protein
MKKTFTTLLVLTLTMLLFTMPTMAQDSNMTDGCVDEYDESVDYFPSKAEAEYAEGFAVEYFNNYKIVSILSPWRDAEEVFEYALVQCGTPAPEGYDDVQIVYVPVESAAMTSTTFLPHMETQGIVDHLVGLDSDSIMLTSVESALDLIADGGITDIGLTWDPNVEVIIELDAAMIMLQQFSPGAGAYASMVEIGLPAVLNADFVETTPLGRAEWGKYISFFFNTEAAANAEFSAVAESYIELLELTENIEERPSAFLNSPWDGTWYMSGGDSFMAVMLFDAGADYPWADDDSKDSLYLDFETVLDMAGDADYWLNVGQYWMTLDDGLAEDERYAEFAAFQNGTLFSNNGQTNANGGNAYYDLGAVNPDVVLADMIAIFHPDLMPDHEFVYYQQIPAGQ